MTTNPLTDAVSLRICTHMNKDHQDAVIAYARHYGGVQNASNVKMISITSTEMKLDADGKKIYIQFDHKITTSEDAHKTLVQLMRNIPK
tara:strand:- start:211 stop:477 length:267 start_codon:yes stop_codon:yes gene_type:complete